MSDQPTINIHIPHFPTYPIAREFLALMDGQSRRTLLDMRQTIRDNYGTPQENRDWTRPEEWIPAILSGQERKLGQHLWEGSKGLVNPRHLTGPWLLCSAYELLVPDHTDILHITTSGQDFLHNPYGDTEQLLDYSEGLLHLLGVVAEHGPGKRADLLPPYSEFVTRYSKVQSQTVVSGRWYDHATNLVDRGLITREGVIYQITKDGLDYLERAGSLLRNDETVPVSKATTDVYRLLDEQQSEVREKIAETLRAINPYQLEHLVKALLQAMGYENVMVTKPSGDGGIDVVADIRIGITHVREVVQVKRHQGNIQRTVLDQLRGSLHRFGANRGTIITTGKFSKGAENASLEVGAAPIMLIDGNTLIDLLIEHNIGVRKEAITILKFAPDAFKLEEELSNSEGE